MTIRQVIARHKYRYAAVAAAIASVAVLGLAQGAQASPPPPNAPNFIRPQYATQYCMAEVAPTQNSKVNLTTICNPSDSNELWYNADSSYGGGGYLEIINFDSGKCLQNPNNGPSGTTLNMYTCNNSESQAWTPGIYDSWVQAIGLCMNGIANQDVDVYTCNDTHSQSWVWLSDMNIRAAIYRHKYRYAAIAAAVVSATVLGLAQTGASAGTYNTMRPVGNTAYCVVNPLDGGEGYAGLIDPCNQGTKEAWATPSSPWGDGTYEIVNEYSGLCLETDGGGVKLYLDPCNGDEAESWFYDGGLGPNGNETTWVSPYTSGGTNYCADANATYGIRAELCNGTNAQLWYGPQSF